MRTLLLGVMLVGCGGPGSDAERQAALEEMAAGIKQNSQNAETTQGIALEMAQGARQGADAVKQTAVAMKGIAEKIAVIEEITRKTDLPRTFRAGTRRLSRACHGALPIRREGAPSVGTPLVVSGHPAGIPLKIAGGATVRSSQHPEYFDANLDTYGGNSGSPVSRSSRNTYPCFVVWARPLTSRPSICVSNSVGWEGTSKSQMSW